MNNRKAFIPISALLGALLLALVATMTPFVADPDRAHAQSQSQETTLYELSIGGQSADPVTVSAFMPAFVPDGAPDAGGYTVYAATTVSSMTVTATASHTGAMVEVKAGATEAAAKASVAINAGGTDNNEYTVTPENAGEDTVILVKVTAADNIATATYKLTVMRGDANSGDTTLSALSLMAGSDKVTIGGLAGDEFASTDCQTAGTCTARVPNTTSMVEVSATPTDARDGAAAAVTSKDKDGDDNTVQNGTVSLSEGANTVTVTVTAADRVTTGTYTVTVTRVPRSESTDTTLTTLSLTDGTSAVSLSPRFRSGTAPASNGYTAKVPSGNSSVVLTVVQSHTDATFEVKAGATEKAAMAATAETGGSPYTIATLAEGTDTVILVTVTADDMATKATYKITVEKAAATNSTVATLSALSVVAGGSDLTLDPEFATGTTAYAASVPYSVSRATVMATPTNRGATYKVTKGTSTTALAGGMVDLDEGANAIKVTVTAADGSTTTGGEYTVTVTRAASTDSRVTTLASLSIADTAGGDNTLSSLEPEFDPDGAPASGGYMAYAATGVTSVDVTATASHVGATVAIKVGADEEAAMKSDAIAGNSATLGGAGESTVILVTVTGADKFATSTYKITVMRGATGSDVITLSALGLMDAGDNDVMIVDSDATNAFAVADCLAATNGCTANVPYTTAMVKVTATPTDARDGATYKVTSNKDSSVQDNQVDLSEGSNIITVTVTGADKVSTGATGTYMVTVTRVASNLSTDTTLARLSLEDSDSADVTLKPEFVPNSTPVEGGYAAEVGNGITSVAVTAVPAHTGATAKVRAGADYDSAMKADAISGDSPFTVTLQGEGADTVILVTVTAADLATTGTHMVTVSREAANDNSELKALSLNGDPVTLPATAPTDGIYARLTVAVPRVTVMATPRNSKAMVVITSEEGDDVEDSVVDLVVGINVITVKVTAAAGPATTSTADDCLTGSPDANIDCYTIRIRRDLSDDASLSMLGLRHMPMDKMEGVVIDLMPMFDAGTMSYTADAGSAEMITVNAKAMHSMAMVSVMVNGTAAMKTDIPMYWDMLGCPAMNDSVRAYDDHDHMDDATSPYCTTYHMDDLGHPGLMGDAKDVVDMTFANYYDVPLMMGSNTIKVTVTAEDGTTGTYTVMVAVDAPDDRARLLALYDTDGEPGIQAGELNTAIQNFLDGTLSAADMSILIGIYLEG